MNYPEDFVKRVKKAYPDWKRLHKALDSGSCMVGKYLSDNTCDSISLEKILKAKDLKKLQNVAELALERNMLYTEWCTLHDMQIPKIN